MKNRMLWAGILLLLSGLVIGFIAGATTARIKMLRTVQKGPEGVRELVMKRLTRTLRLSETQTVDMERIVREAQERLSAIHRANMPAIQSIMEDAVAQAQPLLNPAQKARLEQMREQAQERWGHPALRKALSGNDMSQ